LQARDIQSGQILEGEGKREEALAVYQRCLDDCAKKIASGVPNNRAIDDRTVAIEKIASLAKGFIVEGSFDKALKAVETALPAMPKSPLLNLIRAHALMFLDRSEDAQTLYAEYRHRTH
jgi:Tfp pilus assembly protein PilF